MGYVELKSGPSVAPKSSTGNGVSQSEPTGGRVASEAQPLDSGSSLKDQAIRVKPIDGKLERSENISGSVKKGGSMTNGPDVQPFGAHVDEPSNKIVDESIAKGMVMSSTESEVLPIFCYFPLVETPVFIVIKSKTRVIVC